MLRKIPSAQKWISQMFQAKAVHDGGVIRRKVENVKKYASYTALLAEVRRRKFHLVKCGGQYIVICNTGQMKILR